MCSILSLFLPHFDDFPVTYSKSTRIGCVTSDTSPKLVYTLACICLRRGVCIKHTHKNKIHTHRHVLPLSEGDGGSLSSRSSAEDMVPVEGVLGRRRLKSPAQINTKHTFLYNQVQRLIVKCTNAQFYNRICYLQ